MARLNNGLTPGENARIVASVVDENDLEELEALHTEMLKRVDKAREDGRIYMMGRYVMLASLISPEIKRVRARFHRETLAAVRKEHKQLKIEARNSASA